MKPQTLTVFIAFAALTATAGWVMNPISWTYDEDSRTLTTDGTSSFAIADASLAAKRNPSLIAHGELLGDVALRLMLQRIAYPHHPPCELYLDIPGDKVSRRGQSVKR